ncbi:MULTISPECIES: hypothetical protein [Neisseria]|nr:MULTISPECIES: hypothetical protein [Neisseria]MBF0803163.1 hypothetical protein [Neisseria sp. 19428wB4_WF04]
MMVFSDSAKASGRLNMVSDGLTVYMMAGLLRLSQACCISVAAART